ncbi:hypothetical protein HOH87_03010 [bacterium]|jgi:hypothetical protein|nr:hypothetical protein [bacterium]
MDKTHRLTGFLADKLPKWSLIIGIIALALGFLLGHSNDQSMYLSYLTAYTFFISIVLGCMFLVIVQHLARGGWGVVVRRVPEQMMATIPTFALLFIPILFGMHSLYEWTHASAVAHDHLLQMKAPYLNVPFFVIRNIIYFAVWIGIARYYNRKSLAQDYVASDDEAEQITAGMQKRSAISILLYALTVSFATFDWMMSLKPHWFSTVFGVYYFAGAVMTALCFISLTYMILGRHKHLDTVVTKEHYHDLGKLIYGFVIFWTYIAFSQFFLTWYANIPEFVQWYLPRSVGPWRTMASVLVWGHFLIPLFVFMSRHAKRNLKVHSGIAILLLVMQYLDIQFLIKPNFFTDIHFTLVDVAFLIGIGGIVLNRFLVRLKQESLMPVNDPYLQESLDLEVY